MSCSFSSADRALAQRIEISDSTITQRLIRQAEPFAIERAAGGWCIFGGAGSPVTHAVGIGMQGPVTEAELDTIEEFYRCRGVGCTIDLCPLADAGLIRLLQSRPYRAIEFNNILVRAIKPGETFSLPPMIRRIAENEIATWMRVVSCGFAESDFPPMENLDAISVSEPALSCFLADANGEPVAGAAVGMHEGLAWMSGDAALPAARGKGLQTGLIQARLALAASEGCDLAGAAVLPGSISHRNYLRAGFELVYMRVVLMREFATEVRP